MAYPEFFKDPTGNIDTLIYEIYREKIKSQQQAEFIDAVERFSGRYPWLSQYLLEVGRGIADSPKYRSDLIEMTIKQILPALRKAIDLMKKK